MKKKTMILLSLLPLLLVIAEAILWLSNWTYDPVSSSWVAESGYVTLAAVLGMFSFPFVCLIFSITGFVVSLKSKSSLFLIVFSIESILFLLAIVFSIREFYYALSI